MPCTRAAPQGPRDGFSARTGRRRSRAGVTTKAQKRRRLELPRPGASGTAEMFRKAGGRDAVKKEALRKAGVRYIAVTPESVTRRKPAHAFFCAAGTRCGPVTVSLVTGLPMRLVLIHSFAYRRG
jgi:hypothetical protein